MVFYGLNSAFYIMFTVKIYLVTKNNVITNKCSKFLVRSNKFVAFRPAVTCSITLEQGVKCVQS